jgi:membrane-associated phospholipid phosphatase
VSEQVLIAYFAYVALIAPFFRDRPNLHRQPLYELLAIAAAFLLVAQLEERSRWPTVVGFARDWLPLLFTFMAFREMEFFLPLRYPHRYEALWAQQDHILLALWGARATIEGLGNAIPFYLEFWYLLVYSLGPLCIAILYGCRHRRMVDRFLTIYLLGTLAAYSLLPYFPSQPPRIVFPALDEPHIVTWVRTLNLFILRKGTIHLAVFPSAHVSSAFSAAWGLFDVLPRRQILGWAFVVYAVSVSIATIYGRYHYLSDAVAGFAVSLLAAGVCYAFRNRRRHASSMLNKA